MLHLTKSAPHKMIFENTESKSKHGFVRTGCNTEPYRQTMTVYTFGRCCCLGSSGALSRSVQKMLDTFVGEIALM